MDHTNVSPVGDESVSQEMQIAMDGALRLKSIRIDYQDVWKELYSNEEYHDKIIDQDVQRILKARKQDKEYKEYLNDRGPVRDVRALPYSEIRKKRLMETLGLL